MIRIKLIFDDNILIAEEYRKIWFLIPDSVQYVSDLLYLIKTKFSLKKPSSNELYLVLDEFTLPSTQNSQLIRENDVLIVKTKATNHTGTTTDAQSTSSSDSESSSESAREPVVNSSARSSTEQRDNSAPLTNHSAASVKHASVDSSDSESDSELVIKAKHVVFNEHHSRPVTRESSTERRAPKQPRGAASASHVPPHSPASASHVPPRSQRRGESLGRGYRAPQWPWLPFTLAAYSDTTHKPSADQSRVALSSLQREDVIAFRTMELDGWQPVLSALKHATVQSVTRDTVSVRLLTEDGAEPDEEVTFAAEDLTELTLVTSPSPNKRG